MRAVKTKGARLDLGQAGATLDTGKMFAVHAVNRVVPVAYIADHDDAIAQPQGCFDRIAQPGHVRARPILTRGPFLGMADHNAINDCFNRVHLVAIQVRHFVDLVDLAVDAQAHKALLLQLFKDILMIALAIFDHRSQDQQAAAIFHADDAVHDLGRRLLGNCLATGGAVGLTNAGIEQTQVVVNLGHRADRRAGIAPRALLVNRNRWA